MYNVRQAKGVYDTFTYVLGLSWTCENHLRRDKYQEGADERLTHYGVGPEHHDQEDAKDDKEWYWTLNGR